LNQSTSPKRILVGFCANFAGFEEEPDNSEKSPGVLFSVAAAEVVVLRTDS